jgi:hypothetical protein
MTRWCSTMYAWVMSFLRSSCSVYTTTSLWLYDSPCHPSFISPYDISLDQTKKRPDGSQIWQVNSLYVISLPTFFFTTVEPPAPMVCILRTTTPKLTFSSPRNLASSSQPQYGTMISQKLPNWFVLPFHPSTQPLLSSSSSAQHTWVSR